MSLTRTIAVAVAAASCVLFTAGCSSNSGTASSSGSPSFDASNAQPGGAPAIDYNRWSWFKDTYWIVPPDGIYSVAHSGTKPGQFRVARGQTVFHITDYFNGYFTGAVVVKLTGAQVPNCQYVLGQATPAGQVLMTMYNASTGEVVNEPIGTMTEVDGQWTMVNTMSAPTTGGGTLSHWAYMIQSEDGDPSFQKLPFADQPIPEFMSACPPGPPIEGQPGTAPSLPGSAPAVPTGTPSVPSD